MAIDLFCSIMCHLLWRSIQLNKPTSHDTVPTSHAIGWVTVCLKSLAHTKGKKGHVVCSTVSHNT